MPVSAPTFKPRLPASRPISRPAPTTPAPAPTPSAPTSNPTETLIDEEPDYHDPDLARPAPQNQIRATPTPIVHRPVGKTIAPLSSAPRPSAKYGGVRFGTPTAIRSGTPIATPSLQSRAATPLAIPGRSVPPVPLAVPSAANMHIPEQPSTPTSSVAVTATVAAPPTIAPSQPAEDERHEEPDSRSDQNEYADHAPSSSKRKKRSAPIDRAEPPVKRRKSAGKKAVPAAEAEPSIDPGSTGAQDAAEQPQDERRRSARVASRKKHIPSPEPVAVERAGEEGEGAEDGDAAAEGEKGKKGATKKATKGGKKKADGKKRKFNFMDIDENGNIPDFDDLPAPESQGQGAGANEAEGSKEPARKKRRIRRINLHAIDPNDPGVPLDVGTTRMADLVDDPGVGHVSNRFVEVYRAKQRLNAERKKERDRKREETIEKKRKQMEGVRIEEERERRARGDIAGVLPPMPDGAGGALTTTTEEEEFRETHTAPQVRIGANDEWVIDEESTQIDRQTDPATQPTEPPEVIEDRDSDRFVNSMTFSRKADRRGPRWAKEEIEVLCKGVSMFGYDFEMISRLFVGRSRNMVKNKWKRIEKDDPAMAQHAWESRTTIDLSFYSKHVGANLLVPAAPIIVGQVIVDPPPQPTIQAATASQQASGQAAVEGAPEEEVVDPEESLEKEQDETGFEEVEFDANGPGIVFERESASPPSVDQLFQTTNVSEQTA